MVQDEYAYRYTPNLNCTNPSYQPHDGLQLELAISWFLPRLEEFGLLCSLLSLFVVMLNTIGAHHNQPL